MGKHRFRLSDMMPNAWFYKLKDMNNPRKNHHHHQQQHPALRKKLAQTLPSSPPPPNQLQGPIIPNRASYYFPSNSPVHPKAVDTTHFPGPDSTSTRRRRPPRRSTHHQLTTTSPSPLLLSISSTTTTCRASSSVSVSESESDVHSYTCVCNTNTEAPPPPKLDFVLDLDLDLRPILTKPPAAPKTKTKTKKQDTNLKPTACTSSASIQPRLRTSSTRTPAAGSPNRKVRVAARRSSGRRRGIGESFAVVKSSSDPRRDFRESMMEMISENKLTASKDLEDLLACYLSLNSNEYHDVIVKVFEEIWIDI